MLIYARRTGGDLVLLVLYVVGMFFLTLPPIEPADRVVGVVLIVDAVAYVIDHFTGGKVQGWTAGAVGGLTGAARGWRSR